jgi:heavy metal sensor kinase
MHLTIRWRLTLWNTLALACVLILFGSIVYVLLQRTRERIDHALEDRVTHGLEHMDESLVQCFRQLQDDSRLTDDPATRIKYWVFEFKEHNNVFGVVYDPAGKVLYRTEEMAEASVPTLSSIESGGDRTFQEITVPILGRQRILRSNLRVAKQDYVVVLLDSLEHLDRDRAEVARERAEVEQEFQTVVFILLACIPFALLLIGAVGYWLARKSLAPVSQLNRLAEGITAQKLDHRLPVTHPEDELGRLTKTINAMIERLERSFQEIRRFTADASHEMRTPLTAIRAETELALNKSLSLEEQQQMLISVVEECERLTRLTDQLLTLSREDAGGTHHVRALVDLAALVHNVAETMKPLMEAKELRFEIAGQMPYAIDGDAARLRQVFINLLDNAIKYTPNGGSVTIQLSQEGDKAFVRICDTGIGIAPEHQPHVFERFYRVDKARSRAEGGTGLGLSIARSIIQSHDGEISLTSELGKGTTIVVALPIGAERPNQLEDQNR